MKNTKPLFISISLFCFLVISTLLATEKVLIKSLPQDPCSESIETYEVNGKIFIKNFDLEESYVEVLKNKMGKTFRFSFFSRAPIDLCNDIKYSPGVGADWVSCTLSSPLKIGEYSITSSKNPRMIGFVFINKFGNKYRKLNAQCGLLEITEIKKETVTGRLIAYGDDNSFVSGSFVASRCSN